MLALLSGGVRLSARSGRRAARRRPGTRPSHRSLAPTTRKSSGPVGTGRRAHAESSVSPHGRTSRLRFCAMTPPCTPPRTCGAPVARRRPARHPVRVHADRGWRGSRRGGRARHHETQSPDRRLGAGPLHHLVPGGWLAAAGVRSARDHPASRVGGLAGVGVGGTTGSRGVRVASPSPAARPASTDSGTLNIDGLVRNDRAPKTIEARTTSGNVSLRAR